MKLFFIVLFLSSTYTSLYGQSKKQGALSKVREATTLYDIQSIKESRLRFRHWHSDTLSEGLISSQWLLTTRRKTKPEMLMIISRDSLIVYKEIYRWQLNSQFDGPEHDIIWSEKNQMFPLEIVEDHYSRFPYIDRFGYACGAGGSLPPTGQIMLELVKTRDTVQLKKWLQSINPNRRAYGYLGFRLLEALEISISSEIERIMSMVSQDESSIYYCAGCTIQTYLPLKEILKEDEVKSFADSYVKSLSN